MPRLQTGAEERTEQAHRTVREEAAANGVATLGVREAAAMRRAENYATHWIKARELDLDDDEFIHLGNVIARVEDFKILKSGTAMLQLVTNAHEFGHFLADAAMISRSQILVCALFAVPRKGVLEYPEGHPDHVPAEADANGADANGADGARE